VLLPVSLHNGSIVAILLENRRAKAITWFPKHSCCDVSIVPENYSLAINFQVSLRARKRLNKNNLLFISPQANTLKNASGFVDIMPHFY
jgi:hypothetical protein